jgi:hypothetical protein
MSGLSFYNRIQTYLVKNNAAHSASCMGLVDSTQIGGVFKVSLIITHIYGCIHHYSYLL